jgi:hypothetical protein
MVFNKTNGQPLEDLRIKVPTDLLEFVEDRYGIEPTTGLERSRNAMISNPCPRPESIALLWLFKRSTGSFLGLFLEFPLS